MRISDLRECVILSQTLSFTQTARRLFTTQSAVSKHIAALEAELDIQLFLRDAHGVHLTQAGTRFVDYALKLIECYDEALVDMTRLKAGVARSLTVGYLAGAASLFLPDAINRFFAEHPDTDLSLLTQEIDGVAAGLADGELDMGITTQFVELSADRFETMALYKDRVSIIVPKGHRLAGREEASVDDLRGERVLLSNPSFLTREAPLLRMLITPVLDDVQVTETVGDILGLFLMMSTSRYVTILFDHVRHYSDFSERFSFLRCKEAPNEFDVVIAWKRSQSSAVHEDFARLLYQSVQEKIGRLTS